MTKNQIIQQVYDSHIVVKVAKRYITYITQGNLDDFCQHIYLILCELPESKLQELYEKEQLPYYIFYICKAQATNFAGKFHKIHDCKTNTIPIEDYLLSETLSECNET